MKTRIFVILTYCLVLCFAFTTYANAKNAVEVRHVPSDLFLTIQDAVNLPPATVGAKIKIRVAEGEYEGAVIDKPVTIKGTDGTIITSGVPYKTTGSSLTTAFLLTEGADGTEISHLTIPNDGSTLYFFAIFSRNVDSVSIHHLTVLNSIQGISNYNGSMWNISHNRIFGVTPDGGGGIGILVNAWDGSRDEIPDSTTANDNIIAHNTTEGIVGDVGYSGPGICLSSGHGAAQWPGGTLNGNIVYSNKCTHTGAGGVGFEADDVPYEIDEDAAITGNYVAFNDFRGSTYPLVWYGDEEENVISRNLINNKGGRGEGAAGITPPEIFH